MDTDKVISFQRLGKIRDFSAAFSRLGDDYIFSRLKEKSEPHISEQGPVRVSGITLCLLLKGNMVLEINNVTYHLKPVSLITFHNRAMVSVKSFDTSDIDAYAVFISEQLMQNVQINPNSVDTSIIKSVPSPVLDNLTQQQTSLLKGYMEMLDRNAHFNTESPFIRNAAISIVQALVYQMMQIRYDQIAKMPEAGADAAVNRRLNYVQDFFKLLREHYYKERTLAFYADRLCISPKYLSRLVNESTGRPATEWIDYFVLLEAKNMLRFSNKNVQQVAYALNFPTQSSFGKFFKRLTGLSPRDFQKS